MHVVYGSRRYECGILDPDFALAAKTVPATHRVYLDADVRRGAKERSPDGDGDGDTHGLEGHLDGRTMGPVLGWGGLRHGNVAQPAVGYGM